jgi:serine/threonine-protein kinase RsbW
MPQRFHLIVSSQAERLHEIADLVEHAAHASGLDEKRTYDVQIAVDEACSNIIEHAYQGRPDGTIEIACAKRGNQFVVTIRDMGQPFDPKKVALPNTREPLSRRSIGGLGLYFMHKLMDRVEWKFSTREGNLLIMTKKIKG